MNNRKQQKDMKSGRCVLGDTTQEKSGRDNILELEVIGGGRVFFILQVETL
jgi:hypothetical protein